jgi:hypothetical protein
MVYAVIRPVGDSLIGPNFQQGDWQVSNREYFDASGGRCFLSLFRLDTAFYHIVDDGHGVSPVAKDCCLLTQCYRQAGSGVEVAGFAQIPLFYQTVGCTFPRRLPAVLRSSDYGDLFEIIQRIDAVIGRIQFQIYTVVLAFHIH